MFSFFFKNGNKYEGEFWNGVKNGIGTFRYPNGNIYEGEWKDDKYLGDMTIKKLPKKANYVHLSIVDFGNAWIPKGIKINLKKS